jgi:transmembrane sensor
MDARLVMRATNGIAPETKAEAAAWIVRLHADDRSTADEGAFRDWLCAAPEHARAFEAVTTLWDTADGLRGLTVQRSEARGVAFFCRRTVLAGAGAFAAAVAAFAAWDVAYAGVYETGVGEQKYVVLSDGTVVFLDTDTRIRERFSASLREVDLDRGRADFRVKPDLHRPFVVEAAGHRILAGRTTLDVRRDGNRISIVLLQGRAIVLAAAQAPRALLVRGERAILNLNLPIRVDRPNLVPLTAWQIGQAIFESDTLADAAAEMNRYSTVRLVVEDPVVARLKLSGVYRVGDNEAFAHSVAQLLPVIVEHYPGGIALMRDESRMPAG